MGRLLQLGCIETVSCVRALKRPDISLMLVFTLSRLFRMRSAYAKRGIINPQSTLRIPHKILRFFLFANLFYNDCQITRHSVNHRDDALGLSVNDKH